MEQASPSVSNPVGSSVSLEVSGTQFLGLSPECLCMGQHRETTSLVQEIWKTSNTSRFKHIWSQKAYRNQHQCDTDASSWSAKSMDLLQPSTVYELTESIEA